jgi:L-lactate dehydrogenase complex protein LldG
VTSREFILDAVRGRQPAAVPLPSLPVFAHPAAADLLDDFSQALSRMGGNVARPPAGMGIEVFIRGAFPRVQIICSATPEVTGNLPIEIVREPGELRDVDVGVVRAAFGVAETGSVALSDRQFRINALGFLSQHLVVLLDPSDIVPTLHDAYRDDRGFFLARYATLMTGPSATADIEGVLVRGAQGIRSLTVIPVPRPARQA